MGYLYINQCYYDSIHVDLWPWIGFKLRVKLYTNWYGPHFYNVQHIGIMLHEKYNSSRLYISLKLELAIYTKQSHRISNTFLFCFVLLWLYQFHLLLNSFKSYVTGYIMSSLCINEVYVAIFFRVNSLVHWNGWEHLKNSSLAVLIILKNN